MKEYRYFGKAADIIEGRFTVQQIGKHNIGAARVNGRLIFILNHCPHAGAPICHGRIKPDLTPLYRNNDTPENCPIVLRCPWHGWEFDLETGCAVFPSALRLFFLEYKMKDDTVYVFC
jgi:nitrite reductase (NADH) small subunit